MLPPQSLVRRHDTHRLIPSKYSATGKSVLAKIVSSDQELEEITALDDLTNDRRLAENDLLLGIDVHELVFGVPCHQIINAAFTHAHPLGSRFNGPNRGAWYAAFALETSQEEVKYHRALDLSEIGWYHDDVTYDDYLADFSAEFHDIRGNAAFDNYLDPKSYKPSQRLAEEIFETGSLGIIYPSVRPSGGTCIACFRPALVGNVRKDRTYRFVWAGSPAPTITIA